MTREEREQAIAYLETSFAAESNTDGGWSTHHNNVIRTAIKALEQEPCNKCVYSKKDGYCQYDDITETIPPLEPCKVETAKLQQLYNKGFEDCRQAVLENLSELNVISFYEAQKDSKETYYEIRKMIENLPPINSQEQKTGRWIYLDDFRGKYNENGFKCSECNEHSDYEENFCPNCGAKMKEVE